MNKVETAFTKKPTHFLVLFFKRLIAKKVCTTCSRTSYKVVLLTSLNKYLRNNTSETEVNINRRK